MHDSEYHLPVERTSDSYVLRLIAVSPQSQDDKWSTKHAAMGAGGMNGRQGTPWSEELDSKDPHGALDGEYDLESRASAFILHSSNRRQHIYSTRIYK